MSPFRRKKSILDPPGKANEGPRDLVERTPLSQPATPSVRPSAPAAWYSDSADPAIVRYWDGVAWTRLTKPAPPPSPPPAPVVEPLVAIPDETETPANPDAVTAETSAEYGETENGKHPAADASVDKKSADHWLKETEKAVANAQEVGTPAAWRNASEAAAVVGEMAGTLQVTSYAHQIAEQMTQAAEVAVQQAQESTQAASDAMKTAEQTAQAADEAAQAAQVAAQMAVHARHKAEQMARAAPHAVESAQIATQAAANAGARADELDQIVARARSVNTAQAWSEAMQVALATSALEIDNARSDKPSEV